MSVLFLLAQMGTFADKTLQLLFIVCRPKKKNFCFPFEENKWKCAVSVFCFQQITEVAVFC
jgi:hypothetical protein